AEADLSVALLNVEYTEIRAPIAGVVTRKNVEPGQVAQPGQALLAVVSLDDVWVIANLKETQLRSIRPGMRPEIVVDTFPDRTWKGTVDSIAARPRVVSHSAWRLRWCSSRSVDGRPGGRGWNRSATCPRARSPRSSPWTCWRPARQWRSSRCTGATPCSSRALT